MQIPYLHCKQLDFVQAHTKGNYYFQNCYDCKVKAIITQEKGLTHKQLLRK